MRLDKLYVKTGVSGCVSPLEFACLFIHDANERNHPVKAKHLFRMHRHSAETWFNAPTAPVGKQLGLWASETPRGNLQLTDFGKMVVENVKTRLESEPEFDPVVWKQEQERLKHEKAKKKGQLPAKGELIYIRKRVRFFEVGNHYCAKKGGDVMPTICFDQHAYYGWRKKKKSPFEKKPYAVIGSFQAEDKTAYPCKEKTFTIIMLKGQAVAVQPEAIQKRRPGGQGLNKRKKKQKKDDV